MKKVVGILLVLIMVMQLNLSLAATKSELEGQQEEIDGKIEDAEQHIKEIESKKSETLKEVETLISQISAYEIELEDLQDKIDALQTQIDSAEENIKKKEEEYTKEQELLDERLITMYERGDTSYLDVLLSSDNIVEFISTYYLLTEIVEADTQLLEEIENQKKTIEEEKSKLESDKKEIDTVKATKESTYTKLKNAQSQKKSYVNQLSQEEKETQKELEQFEKDKKEIQNELKKLAEQSKQSVTNIANTPSSSGYISPLAGKTKANITTGYMGYTNPARGNHTGVDFAIAAGTPIRAVKDGTVVISTALRYANGNYRSFGEYIVIDHHDGTMTLYGHMLSGSRKVSVGQTVTQGQTIGLVGSTGNSTGNHLHFEVRINGSPVNPTPYLP